jgi:hypothetical protein
MENRISIILLIFVIGLALVVDTALSDTHRPAHNLNEIFPQRLIDMIIEADQIAAALLCDSPVCHCEDRRYCPLVSPHKIQEVIEDLDDPKKQELKNLLTNRNSYMLYDPPAGRFGSPSSPHYVFILFPEDMTPSKQLAGMVVTVFVNLKSRTLSIRTAGTRVGIHVDYSADKILDLVYSIFPKDPETEEMYNIRKYGTKAPPN